MKVSLEFNALTCLKKEHILRVFENDKDSAYQYLQERIASTNNNLLKAKYYHLLYLFTNNNKNISHAIDAYKMALVVCLNDHEDQTRHLRFQEILNIVIELSIKFKYKVEELKTHILNYLSASEIYDRMKTWIIDSVVKSKLFKVSELKDIPALCLTLATKETNHRFIEINLLLALDVTIKIQDNELIEKINELLGDNEFKNLKHYDGRPENMAIPHQNNIVYKKIMQYYKRAKNENKFDSATLAYNANKKQCSFIRITGPSIFNDKLTEEQIETIINSVANQHTRVIVCNLIWGDIVLLHGNDVLDAFVEQNKDGLMLELMRPSIHDINNNQQETSTIDYLRFTKYKETIPYTTHFVLHIILTAIQNGNLSYRKIAGALSEELFLGFPLTITRDDKSIEYTWFQMVDTGIKSFFEQCRLIIKNKQPNWSITLDVLSLKFEGILRDIVGLLSGVITKIDKNGNTTDYLLDDLLRSEVIKQVFTQDDINLFQFTFTSKGYNIRNDVAHSFYKPQDYSMQKAILVL